MQRGSEAVRCINELEREAGREILPPLRSDPSVTAGRATGAALTAEQTAEQVAHAVGANVEVEPTRTTTRAAAAPGAIGISHWAEAVDFVVLLALCVVAKHVIGGGDILELLLGLGIAGVGIGMQFACEFAVRLGDLLGISLVGDAQGLVVVLVVPLSLRSHDLPLDLHHSGAEHATLPAITGTKHFAHDGLAAVTFLMHDCVGVGRVKGLPVEVHDFKTLLLQHAEQRRPDRLNTDRAMGERRLACVEDRQETVDDTTSGAVDFVSLLTGDALAVVLEVGLQTQGDVLELVALREEIGDVGLDRIGG